MIRTATLLISSLMISAMCRADNLPVSWDGFKSSPNKKDRNAAASVEKEAKDPYRKTCVEWGKGLRAKTETRMHAARQAYLSSHGMTNGLDVGHARERRLAIGMTACGVFAAYGVPDKVNTTERAGYDSAQIIYRDRETYVYVESVGNSPLIVKAIQR